MESYVLRRAIHLNRVLRQLRETGLLTFREGNFRFDDLDALVRLAEFDMDYLTEVGPPAARRPLRHSASPTAARRGTDLRKTA